MMHRTRMRFDGIPYDIPESVALDLSAKQSSSRNELGNRVLPEDRHSRTSNSSKNGVSCRREEVPPRFLPPHLQGAGFHPMVFPPTALREYLSRYNSSSRELGSPGCAMTGPAFSTSVQSDTALRKGAEETAASRRKSKCAVGPGEKGLSFGMRAILGLDGPASHEENQANKKFSPSLCQSSATPHSYPSPFPNVGGLALHAPRIPQPVPWDPSMPADRRQHVIPPHSDILAWAAYHNQWVSAWKQRYSNIAGPVFPPSYMPLSPPPPLCPPHGNSVGGPMFHAAQRGKPRKGMLRRAVFSDAQRKGLEKLFLKKKYISKQERHLLAEKLGLKDAQVKIWFQNRRMKWRNNREREMMAAASKRDKNPGNRSHNVSRLETETDSIVELDDEEEEYVCRHIQEPREELPSGSVADDITVTIASDFEMYSSDGSLCNHDGGNDNGDECDKDDSYNCEGNEDSCDTNARVHLSGPSP